MKNKVSDSDTKTEWLKCFSGNHGTPENQGKAHMKNPWKGKGKEEVILTAGGLILQMPVLTTTGRILVR